MALTQLPTPRLLTDGLTMVESGRWHRDRLWFAHWGSGEVVAADLDGDFLGGGAPEPGWIRLIEADGTARDVAGDIDFPNGVLTRRSARIYVTELA